MKYYDGMPDDFENLYGFDPANPTDGPEDANGDGYTNIEEYLNGTNPIFSYKIIEIDGMTCIWQDNDSSGGLTCDWDEWQGE